MSDYLVTDTELTSIADAIRTKGGTSANLSFPTGFVNAIGAISSGKRVVAGTLTLGTNVSSGAVTIATASDIGFTPKYAILYNGETYSSSSIRTKNHVLLALCVPYTSNNGLKSFERETLYFNSYSSFTLMMYMGNNQNETGYLGTYGGEIKFTASSSCILGAGTWIWMAIEDFDTDMSLA